VDFENFTDTLIMARNAGVIVDYQTRARILDNFAFSGRRCAHIAAHAPGRQARVQLLRAFDAPPARGNTVLEFAFRPVIDKPARLQNWPVLRCFTPGTSPGRFELKYLNDPVFGADVTLDAAKSEGGRRPVAIQLYANGRAADGKYSVDVTAHGGTSKSVIRNLPQAAWTCFILHRCDRAVHLFAGPQGRETFVGTYGDILPGGELFMIALGNPDHPGARGSGYWDCFRLGKPLKGKRKLCPPEGRIRHVGEVSPRPPKSLALGKAKHLFVDDWSTDVLSNIRRTFHRPRKHGSNPLIVPDRPWETNAIYRPGGVERQANGVYRMWYYAADPTPRYRKRSHTCLAVSDDGVNWVKPSLRIHEYDGSKENNIVIMERGPGSVIVDPEDPRPEFRYKVHLRYHGTEGWTSPDGLHWTRHGCIIPQSLDATQVMLDPVKRKYVASVKLGFKGRRYRGYAESDDFLHWADTCLMADVDELDVFGDQIYAMPSFRYESLYLGLCKVYHVQTSDTCDIQLAVSHNGTHWRRPYRPLGAPTFATKEDIVLDFSDEHAQPFIPTGKPGSWDFGNNSCPTTPPIREGGELRFYYSGRPCTHGHKIPSGYGWSGPMSAIGLATLRVDGFVSADADASGGYIVTKPLTLGGEDLFVNADAKGGDLRVEVLDHCLRPIRPFAAANARRISSDAVRKQCGWKGTSGISGLAGRTVRLKFHLSRASLFAFWCE